MNDTVAYEFGVDREKHIRTGALILKTALATVPFFWNQLSALQDEKDTGFRTEPDLMNMRRKLAAHLDSMSAAVAGRFTFLPLTGTELIDPLLLKSPHFGEYAENTLVRHHELQDLVTSLADQA